VESKQVSMKIYTRHS